MLLRWPHDQLATWVKALEQGKGFIFMQLHHMMAILPCFSILPTWFKAKIVLIASGSRYQKLSLLLKPVLSFCRHSIRLGRKMSAASEGNDAGSKAQEEM